MPDPIDMLQTRFADAIRSIGGGEADPLITRSKRPELGDFQSNAAMPLAKKLGEKPRDVALKLVQALDLEGFCEPVSEADIAGPGFINVRLLDATLVDLLEGLGEGLGVELQEPTRVVVDLCGVNLAKTLHVGHLRSTIIGDTLARIFRRLGHTVIRQNHVGDWGLPIAMVTHKCDGLDLDTVDLDTLSTLYKDAQLECRPEYTALKVLDKYDHPKARAEIEAQVASAEDALNASKETLVKLQSHDPETVAIWQKIAEITMRECLAACVRLHTEIAETDSAGESSYAEELAPLVDDLIERGIAEESDGAIVVRVEGIAEPCIVRKRDGGFLYATTDLAGIRRRVQDLEADRCVYAVDARQGLHFRQVFGAAIRAGYATRGETTASLEHAAFGMVLGEDHRPLKSRSGETFKLTDLIDEAVEAARAEVVERNPGLSPEETTRIAEVVGVAAIKYADLSNDRAKDYVFSLDRMVKFEGDTGPYLLYAYARTSNVLRKATEAGAKAGSLHVVEPAEKDLALALLRYGNAVESAASALEPHRICQYLMELATTFSTFYDQCPVLKAPDEGIRGSRLRLVELTKAVLADGLETLGIHRLERM